jgi:hypothetical protein
VPAAPSLDRWRNDAEKGSARRESEKGDADHQKGEVVPLTQAENPRQQDLKGERRSGYQKEGS